MINLLVTNRPKIQTSLLPAFKDWLVANCTFKLCLFSPLFAPCHIIVVIILLYCTEELNVVGMGTGAFTKQDLKESRFKVGAPEVKRWIKI